jgi:hypothetical protein
MEPSSTERATKARKEQRPGGRKSEPTEPIERKDIAPSNPDSGKDECYLMLAQVNLLKIRKQIDAAVELCETALQNWPFRADGHALMGDLYHEQGRLDDAILRYCRVLELDPQNKPNRKKLAELVREKRQQLRPETDSSSPSGGLRMDRFVRAIILVLATVMLVTIMMAPVVFQRRRQTEAGSQTGLTVDRQINLSPIVLQPTVPDPNPGNVQTPATADISEIRDPVEQALVDLMDNDKTLLQQGIQVLDAQEEPEGNSFSITYLDRPAGGLDANRTDILRNSLVVAQSASDRFGQRNIQEFTIRCLLLTDASPTSTPTPGSQISGTTSLVFTGTIQRSAIPSDSLDLNSATYDDMQAYFTNPWWNIDIQ